MKRYRQSILILFFWYLVSLVNAQTLENPLRGINKNTILLDESGMAINILTYIEKTNSGEWLPVVTMKDSTKTVQLRKSTATEKKKIVQMMSIGIPVDRKGQKAPKFRLKDLNGNIVSSAKSEGKVIVLNFWFTQCKPCILEFPELNRVYASFKDNKDVVFAAITFNKKNNVTKFLKKYSFDYPIVTDAQELCDQFNIGGYPVNIVIDGNGHFFSYTLGGPPQEGLSNVIQEALKVKRL